MHIRRSPSGDGPTIYRPNESVAVRLDPPPRPVAYEPDSIPPPPRDSLLIAVNRRRGQILTVMVSVAAIASFGSVVWWAHNQDVKAGGKGLEPLVVQAPTTPTRIKPENAGGLVPPNQDKEVFNRIAPGAVPIQPEKLLPGLDRRPSCRPTACRRRRRPSRRARGRQDADAAAAGHAGRDRRGGGPTPPPAGATTPATPATPATTDANAGARREPAPASPA